jgi:hypothetical protein
LRSCVKAARLGVAGQEDAGHAIGEEDGHRVIVGVGVEAALSVGGRRDDILEYAVYSRPTFNSRSFSKPIERIESLHLPLRFRVILGTGAHELEVLR